MQQDNEKRNTKAKGNIKTKHPKSFRNVFKCEDEKILNTQSEEEIFISISESFKSILEEVVVDSEEVWEILTEVQELIQKKLFAYKCSSNNNKDSGKTSKLQNLLSCKSLALSQQSVCSDSSTSLQELDNTVRFRHFLMNVNCPFCSLLQTDKIALIKHLDESCSILTRSTFEKTAIPYSAFQILPNNTIKCNLCQNSVQKNLKQYFSHAHSLLHVSTQKRLSERKLYTEFLFCSCCKILVPNNFTQLQFHMSHDVHKRRSNKIINHSGNCVYTKNKKFKCLDCPLRNTYQSTRRILEHFDDPVHKKNMNSENLPQVFCEFCNELVHACKVLSHFTSSDHMGKEKNGISEDSFELCYYCGFLCKNLKELSVHMKTQCDEIMRIREQEQKVDRDYLKNKSNKEKLTNLGLGQTEKSGTLNKPSFESKEVEESVTESIKGRVLEGDNTKEGLQIIVKDNTNLPELYKYFKKFGEIKSLEICEEKNVLIDFREKSAAEDVLLLRDVIIINGVKVEIATEKELIKAGEKAEKTKKEDEQEQSLGQKTNILDSDDNDNTYSISNIDYQIGKLNPELDQLFLRVSQHLRKNKASHSNLEDKILMDCAKIFGQKKCSLCGFAGCRISFPVESITLYCGVLEEFQGSGGMFATFSSFTGDRHFQKNLLKAYYRKFCDDPDWEDVTFSTDHNFPQIECRHRETQKKCTFTFVRSVKLLTDMLSYCIKKIKGLELLCLMVRFWISVQELKIQDFEFAIISLLIFFFMNENIMPEYSLDNLLKTKAASFFTALQGKLSCKTFASEKELPASINVMEMFHAFLKMLLEIGFAKNAIYIPFDCPVPKTIFMDHPYSSFLDFLDPECLMNSSMCVIDPELRVNLTADINENDLKLFLDAARCTIKNIIIYNCSRKNCI